MKLRLSTFAILILCHAVLADYSPDVLYVKLSSPARVSALDGQLRTSSVAVNALVDSGAISEVIFSDYALLSESLEQILELRFPYPCDIESLVEQLARDSGVEWTALNNHYRTVQSLDDGYEPIDSLYNDAWWLEKIDAGLAWQITQGDTNIVIGIIDTGVDYEHRDLIGNIWHNNSEIPGNGVDDDVNGFIDDIVGWDFVDAPSLPSGGDYLVRDNDPMDEFGHGTYVSGCAAAMSDNPDCYPSIGFNCRIMPLRAGNANGTLEEDDVAAALLYGAANGAAIINMSFGDVVASPLLREVISIVHESGVVLVASAGNANNNGIHYPSGFSEVIAVGATDRFDRRASFSNLGPSVDVMAPGVDIFSTILGGTCGEWVFTSGTSYASPMVAGIAGLVLSVNSSLSPDDVLDILKTTADDLSLSGWDSSTVNGRVNARRAVESASYGAEAVARIIAPATDAGVRGEFAVIGDAQGTAFVDYSVDFGLGENPRTWASVGRYDRRVLNDTLALVQAPNVDTVLVVRLTVRATTGVQSVEMAHLYVQNGPPLIDSMRTRLVLDGPGYGQQILAWSNQFGRASLLMTNSTGDSIREDFGYAGDEHVAVISQNRYSGDWQAVLQITNLLGETVRSAPFAYSSIQSNIRPYLYNSFSTSMPHGIVCNLTSDYDCDSRPEIWLLPVDNLNFVDTLEAWEWSGTEFLETENTYGPHIPQWIGDADNDGLIEMAARRGVETRIWEQTDSCSILNNLVFQSPESFGEFLVSKSVVIDSSTGRGDILARTSIGTGSRMALFRVVGDNYEVVLRDTLTNVSSGLNHMGPPGSAIGDFDGDGRIDIVYGDYDGDIVWNEWNGSEMVAVWTTRLQQNDATSWMVSGDFDCDGNKELVAGCRSNSSASSESQRLLMGWDYYVFDSNGDNEFVVVDSIAILGNENVSFNPASVVAADVNADGCDDILISAYPDFYIFSRNSATGRYEAEWYTFPSKAGGLSVGDFNNNGINEILMSDGERQVRIENAIALSHAPFPPVLSGYPENETTVRLEWSSVQGAVHYEVYAANENNSFQLLTVTTETQFVWGDAPTDSTVRYAVATFDTTFEQPISVYSNILELIANSPPAVFDTALQVASKSIAVEFDEPMNASIFVQGNWRLGDGTMPAVIAENEGMRVVYLTFDEEFAPGHFELHMRNLRDALGTPLPASESVVYFMIQADSQSLPYIVAHRLVDFPAGNHVEIEFSEPMSLAAGDPANYVVIDPRRNNVPYNVLNVRPLDAQSLRYELETEAQFPLGAVGVEVHIRILPMAAQVGTVLEETSLLISQSASNLSRAYVYPNPFRGKGAAGSGDLYFAALPEKAVIRIFSLDGVLLRKIQHSSSTGHAAWDMRTEDGNSVASGIYLYSIESDGEEIMGKIAVLR